MIETFDLLLDFDELDALLRDSTNPLDAFLLAAGMSQITEDYVHRDVLALGKIADHLTDPVARVLVAVRTALQVLRPAAQLLSQLRPEA
jgi:hypothetical protein